VNEQHIGRGKRTGRLFGRNAHERWSRFDYAPCWWCGQRVAHTKAGKVLHVHARSAKCRVQGSARAESHRDNCEIRVGRKCTCDGIPDLAEEVVQGYERAFARQKHPV
jgi:hypothetical protein